jgi:hypothetical protein
MQPTLIIGHDERSIYDTYAFAKHALYYEYLVVPFRGQLRSGGLLKT